MGGKVGENPAARIHEKKLGVQTPPPPPSSQQGAGYPSVAK